MLLTDLCRKREIGANCLLLEVGPYRLLIDAGIHPKYAGWEATPQLDLIEPDSLDFILLTHCHLDHVGSLPLIVQRNPSARVLTTIPNQMLVGRVLMNSHNVMKRQREELKIAEYPLYTLLAIGEMEKRIMPMAYGKPRSFDDRGERIEITFHPSGHVPGAAGISIKRAGEHIFMTGDVLFEDQKTIPGARFPKEPCDVLIMETTRGTTERVIGRSRPEEAQRFMDTLLDTLDDGGSVLVPVFALGRMQEIISYLHEAYKAGTLPDVPIFCSGLGMALVEYFDFIARRTGLVNFREKMVKDLRIRTLKAPLVPGRVPKKQAIYLLSSGMLVENTPSYFAAAALAADPRSSFLFVGYCDPETPGGEILLTPQDEPFYFKGIDYATPLRAHVERFDLSGHADREELLAFAQAKNPRTIVLTHGDPEARDWFLHALAETMPQTKVVDPDVSRSYSL